MSCPGCTGASAGPALDDPTAWVLSTSWESVGAYRRAVSSYHVTVAAVPLMYRVRDEPSAFEGLLTWTPAGGVLEQASAIASGPGEAG